MSDAPAASPTNASPAASSSSTPSSSPSSTKDQRVAAAYQQFEKQRHVEAALEFEGLWRDYKEPRFLFNAAVTRYTARHYAHAVAYLNEYLALEEVKGQDRVEAEAQLAVARREVTTVQAHVAAPEVTGEVSVTARWVSEFASDLRPPLPIKISPTADGRSGVTELDAGTWTLRAEGPGAEASEVQVKVVPGGPIKVDLALAPVAKETGPGDQGAKDRPRDDRAFAWGSMGVGAGMVVIGAVLTGVGQSRFNGAVGTAAAECANDAALIDCSSDVRRGLTLRSAGTASLGVGVGALATSWTWLIKNPTVKRRSFIIEAGVGGAFLLGGVIGVAVGAKQVNEVNAKFGATDADTWAQIQGGVKGPAGIHSGTAFLLGAGLGMAANAVIGIAVGAGGNKASAGAKVARTLRVDGGAGRGAVGLTLSGRF